MIATTAPGLPLPKKLPLCNDFVCWDRRVVHSPQAQLSVYGILNSRCEWLGYHFGRPVNWKSGGCGAGPGRGLGVLGSHPLRLGYGVDVLRVQVSEMAVQF